MAEDLKPQSDLVIEWREEYCGGIEEVDRQHQYLFLLVKNMSLENIEATLDELANYVFTHFSTEKKLMELSCYPDCDLHCQVHDGFVLTVAECIACDQEWDNDRIYTLRDYLNSWLIDHIMVEDQKFSQWYQNYQFRIDSQATADQGAKKQGWFTRIFARK